MSVVVKTCDRTEENYHLSSASFWLVNARTGHRSHNALDPVGIYKLRFRFLEKRFMKSKF